MLTSFYVSIAQLAERRYSITSNIESTGSNPVGYFGLLKPS